MIILILTVFGLILGSFVNALVWRLHEQVKSSKKSSKELSISRGRSMCVHCKHILSAKDLVPLISWISLLGKCRYCKKPISAQYPAVELITALLFVVSYLLWPVDLTGLAVISLILWFLILTGLIALAVYDLRWMLLPNRIMLPLGGLAIIFATINVVDSGNVANAALNSVLAVAVGGGIFHILFQFSQGKWIGGGDVKLGWLLGLLVATPVNAVLMIFIASLAGSLMSLPLLAKGRVKRNSTIPFGPFLILGAIVVQFFGADIVGWYKQAIFIS